MRFEFQAADNTLFLVRWNEREVIVHSYADVIEMKRANVRNYAFVRRVIEMKRTSVNDSNANAKLRLRLVLYLLWSEI